MPERVCGFGRGADELRHRVHPAAVYRIDHRECGRGFTDYARLTVGTVGYGATGILNSGVLANTVTQQTINVAAKGVTAFVRLYYLLNGTWQYTDGSYTESGTSTPPSLNATTPGSSGNPTTISWNAGVGAALFRLTAGTTGYGTYDILNGSVLANTVTQQSVSVPSNGKKVYVRLYYLMNGTWNYTQGTFTESP